MEEIVTYSHLQLEENKKIYLRIEEDKKTYKRLEEDKKIYFKSIFDRYDDDGDGQISVTELEKMLKTDADVEVSHKIVKKLVKYSDKNKDGTISLEEFIDMVHDKNFKQLFGRYVDSYVNFIVPRYKQHKFKRIGRSVPVSATAIETDGSRIDGEYEETFSCCPPPIALVIMSLFEIACFVADEATQPDSTKYGDGVVAQLLIYDPYKRKECWRFLSYMFVHIGYVHLTVNLLTQVLLGVPLEMANEWWRVIAVYFAGVVAGSLVTSITDPGTYLAGASGGVYAIITAHLANIIMNWSEMTYPSIQLFIFCLLIFVDVGTAVHNRYYLGLDQNIGYAAHIGGALAGLLVGIWILKNVEPTEKEKYLWWAAFVIYILLMGTAIMLNIFWTDHFLKQI